MKISVRDGKFRLSLRLPLGIGLRAAARACKGEGAVQLVEGEEFYTKYCVHFVF